MTELSIQLRGVAERDIDLFLAEELVASPAFRAWFTAAIDLGSGHELVEVERSALSSNGESDLALAFSGAGGKTVVLVENKIDAVMQPRQAERYRERAELLQANSGVARVLTLLVSPEKYSPDSAGFDRRITYEQMRDVLVSGRAADARMTYKLRLLELAMDRARAGWVAVPSESTSAFWMRYFALATELAPELRMPKPGAKPAGSGFIVFRPTSLPKGVRLLHKMPYGRVDLQFNGRAKEIESFRVRYEHRFSPGMYLAPANKSFAVRIDVPLINLDGSVAAAEAAIRDGIDAAERLRDWFTTVAPNKGAT